MFGFEHRSLIALHVRYSGERVISCVVLFWINFSILAHPHDFVFPSKREYDLVWKTFPQEQITSHILWPDAVLPLSAITVKREKMEPISISFLMQFCSEPFLGFPASHPFSFLIWICRLCGWILDVSWFMLRYLWLEPLPVKLFVEPTAFFVNRRF